MSTRIGKRKYIRQRARSIKKGFDPKFYASCYNKTRFDKAKSKETAQKLGIKFYRCRYCPYYHIGRSQKWRSITTTG